MKTVTRIPQRVQQHTLVPLNSVMLRKAVGYARVSTDDQENSYEAQMDYFTSFINSRPDMEFVHMYSDEGVSGTGGAKRHGFEQMIEDALAGQFSLIITKSISRFARNTVTTLTTIRELKAHGVEVWFQKENIQTFDSKGELLITIMSSLAQEESRSISENVSWGIRKSFADGKVTIAYKHFLGYRLGPDGNPEIDPAEADVVSTIYKRFLDGETPSRIARDLTMAGYKSPGGKDRWSTSTVQSILSNEKYKGEAILQKCFTTDFLTKRKKRNEGELPQYHVANSHPAIIPPETWDLAQLETERRSRLGSKFSSKGPLSCRLVCSDCGAFYGSKVWHSTDGHRRVIWRCNQKYNKGASRTSGGGKCVTGHVTEPQIMAAFDSVALQLLQERGEVLRVCRETLVSLLDMTSINGKIEKASSEAEKISNQVKNLINQQSRGTVEGFSEKYAALEKKFNAAQDRISRLEMEKANQEYMSRQAAVFLETMEGAKLGDTGLFVALVDKVIVGKELTFILRDGSERDIS